MVLRLFGTIAIAALALSAPAAVLQQPAVSAKFFNPTIGQSVSLSFRLAERATITARVLDRDGVPVRTLASKKLFPPGAHRLAWDGRDDSGAVVPNESWSFRLDLDANGKREMYFPADRAAEMVPIKDATYDRKAALLRYTLPVASRVHLQAGVATIDHDTNVVTGPVLKTVVNREPRGAGAVIERWNGRDESGTIVVPDLPNFVVAVATTALPENSVITVGSRGKSFIDTIAARKGASLLTPHHGSNAHHQRLSALQDVTPRMDLAVTDERERFTVRGAVTGASAESFTKLGGDLMLFVDGKLLRKQSADAASFSVSIARVELTAGMHILAVNWVTPTGPTAANSLQIIVR